MGLELAAAVVVSFTAKTRMATHEGQAVSLDATAPARLEFACDQATEQLGSFFSNAGLIEDLRQLRAGVVLSLADLSDGRARVVWQLNQAGIPVTAWLSLPAEQGYYVNANNAPEAGARFAAFERWTSDYGLRWAGAGLDIEPNLQEFGAVRQGHPWRLVAAVAHRCLDTGGVKGRGMPTRL